MSHCTASSTWELQQKPAQHVEEHDHGGIALSGGGGDEDHSEECSSIGAHSMQEGHHSSSTVFTPSPSTILHAPPTQAPLASIASWETNLENGKRKTKERGPEKPELQQPSVTTPASATSNTDDEHVTINLSSGEDLYAKPYENSVSGHHVMLQQEGLIWKATRSHREERFYVTMRYCSTDEAARPKIVGTSSNLHPVDGTSSTAGGDSDGSPKMEEDEDRLAHRTLSVKQILGESVPDDDLVLSAASLAQFVPKFFGMRQVRKLRCSHDLQTPASATQTSGDFPSTPREERFDAAARHTAEEIVASFQSLSATASHQGSVNNESVKKQDEGVFEDAVVASSEHDISVDEQEQQQQHEHQSEAHAEEEPLSDVDPFVSFSGGVLPVAAATMNPALRRNTLLPAKAPENGRPLDHNLPRTADQLVDMIVLEDVCHGFLYPCVLDIKMGSRQYGVNAPEEKRLSKAAKAKRSASSSLGLRISGYKRWNPKSRVFEAKGKRECFSYGTNQIEATLLHFFDGDAQLIAKFHKIVQDFEEAFHKQTAFRFFTSSVLLVFDGERPTETARLAMVDFAYTYRRSELVAAKDEDAHDTNDMGYLRGIESLNCMLGHVLQRCLQQQL